MFINHKSNTGFTLIELLVTISIIVILTFVGVPTFKSVTNNSRISATNNSLVGNLALARSEAVNRNKPVSVCASSDGSSCTSTAWELGWIVFTDGGTAGAVDGSDKILRVQKKTIGRLTVTSSGPYVRFKPGGEVALNETAPSLLARLLHSLLPGKAAWASEGDDTSTSSTDSDSDSDSSSSDSDSTSGSGGSGGGATLMSCVAPASAVGGPDDTSTDSASSDSTSSDSGSSDSASSDSADSDSNSGDSQSSDSASSDDNSGDSTSGSSTASSGSAGTATCDGQPLAANSFLICDASKSNEIGNLVTVTNTGRISQIKVRCN